MNQLESQRLVHTCINELCGMRASPVAPSTRADRPLSPLSPTRLLAPDYKFLSDPRPARLGGECPRLVLVHVNYLFKDEVFVVIVSNETSEYDNLQACECAALAAKNSLRFKCADTKRKEFSNYDSANLRNNLPNVSENLKIS